MNAQTSSQTAGAILPFMGVRWKLREFLNAHDITPHQLALKTENKLSQKTVYSLANARTGGVRFDTLEAIIPALSELTGKNVTVQDLLEYQPDTNN
jgi:DNA-binding Xre family transcriptional regulator